MTPERKTNASRRSSRTTEIIAHEAARFIVHEAGSESLITVVRALPLAHGERMIVFVTVFPEEKSRSALAFLERQREAFSDHMKKYAHLSPLPRIDFQLENGEGVGEVPKN